MSIFSTSGRIAQDNDSSFYFQYHRLFTNHVGALTHVFLDDIVRQKNLDYLEHLAQMVEAMNLHPIWFQQESTDNKMKLLQVYQLSLSYAINTSNIYDPAQIEMDQIVAAQKHKVSALYAKIVEHKNSIAKAKKKYKKHVLLREKKKLQNYEKKMIYIRNELIKKKFENQQISFTEQDSQNTTQNYQPQIVYIPPTYQNYPPPPLPPQNYHHQYNHPHNMSNHYQYQQQMPTNMNENPQHLQYNNFPNPHNYNNQSARDLPKPNSLNVRDNYSHQKQVKKDRSVDILNKTEEDKGFSITHSKVVVKEDEDDESYAESELIERNFEENNDILASGTGQFRFDSNFSKGNQNSNSLQKYQADSFARHQIIDSEINDQVNDLETMQKKKTDDLNSMVSKKSSFSQNQIDSLIQVQLKTQSTKKDRNISSKHKIQNKLKEQIKKNQKQPERGNYLLTSNQGSVQKSQKFGSQLKLKNEDEGNMQKSKQKASIFMSNQGSKNKGELKFGSELKMKDEQNNSNTHLSAFEEKKSGERNHLLVSNQGGKAQEKNISLRLKESSEVGIRMTDSDDTEEIQSPRKQKMKSHQKQDPIKQQQSEEYDQDFDDFTDSTPQVNLMSKSPRMSQTAGPRFVTLQKKTFTLRQNAENSLAISNIRSINDLNLRMSTKHKQVQKSVFSSTISDDLDLINMPLESHFARPSKAKQSTVYKKSQVIKKIPQSQSKEAASKNVNRQIKKTSSDIVQDAQSNTFHMMKDNLVSIDYKKIDTTPQLPKINKKESEHQKLNVQCANSFVLNNNSATQQNKNEGKEQKSVFDNMNEVEEAISEHQKNDYEEEESINLNIEPSNLMEKEKKQIRERIQQLIKNKYKQTNLEPFDKNVIKKQIQKNVEKQDCENWEEIIDIFQKKISKKKADIKKRTEIAKQKQKEKNERSDLTKSYAMAKSEVKKEEDDLNYSQSLIENKDGGSLINMNGPEKLKSKLNEKKRLNSSQSQGNKSKEQKNRKVETKKEEKNERPSIMQVPRANGNDGKSVSKFAREISKNDRIGELKQKNKYNMDDEVEDALRKQALQVKKTISDQDFDD